MWIVDAAVMMTVFIKGWHISPQLSFFKSNLFSAWGLNMYPVADIILFGYHLLLKGLHPFVSSYVHQRVIQFNTRPGIVLIPLQGTTN